VPAATRSGGSASKSQSVKIALYVPAAAASTSSRTRSPLYISSATDSVVVTVKDTTSGQLLGTSTTDIASGSSACGGTTGARTCTIYVPVEPTSGSATDTIVFATYDQEPVNGTVPYNANLLSVGSIIQAIAAGSTNVLDVALAGIAATVTVTPTNFSWSGGQPGKIVPFPDGTPHHYTFTVGLQDADGRTIVVANNDPSNPGSTGTNNPYQPTVTFETEQNFVLSFPQHTTFTAPSSDLSQPVTVTYDGGGTATDGPLGQPYSSLQDIVITYPSLTPGLAPGQATTVTGSFTINPMYVGVATNGQGDTVATTGFAADGFANSPTTALSFDSAGQSATLTATEAGASSFTTSSTGTACAGLAVLGSPVIPNPLSAGAPITFVAQPVAPGYSGTTPIGGSGCNVVVSDAYGNAVTTTVNYTVSGISIVIPSSTKRKV